MQVKDLSPRPGVIISDFTVDEVMSESVATFVRKLFRQSHLLIFRGVTMSPEEYLAVLGVVGTAKVFRNGESITRISNVDGDPTGTRELLFHSDAMFMKTVRVDGLSLYAEEVHPGSQETHFVSCTRGYEALMPGLKAKLEGLRALNVLRKEASGEYSGERVDPQVARQRAGEEFFPAATEDIVQPCPCCGRLTLCVSEYQTAYLVGMDGPESEALLQDVWRELYRPEFVYEHRWEVGDALLWNNYAVQHARRGSPTPAPRTLRRVVVVDWREKWSG